MQDNGFLTNWLEQLQCEFAACRKTAVVAKIQTLPPVTAGNYNALYTCAVMLQAKLYNWRSKQMPNNPRWGNTKPAPIQPTLF